MKIFLIILSFLICAKMWSKYTSVIYYHHYYKDTYNPTLKIILLALSTIAILAVDILVLKISWLWILVALVVMEVIKTTFDVIAKGKNDGLVPISISEKPVWIRLIIIIILTTIVYFL